MDDINTRRGRAALASRSRNISSTSEAEVDLPRPTPRETYAQTLVHRTSISAMAYFKGVIFYAEGGSLFFKSSSNQSKHSKHHKGYSGHKKIFPRESQISHLSFKEDDEGDAMIPGKFYHMFVGTRSEGKILSFSRGHGKLTFRVLSGSVTDWTIASHFISEPYFALVTMSESNKALIWKIEPSIVKMKSWSCEKSHIMAGTLVGQSITDLILFSGTFSAEILVWRVEEEDEDRIHILYRLNKHFGWVYSLKYYPEDGLLLSTSDDRTIIVWRFSYTNGHDYPLTDAIWFKTANYDVEYTFFAHRSKVLCATMHKNRVISCGDDGKVCLWGQAGKLELTWDIHRGSPVLCIAVNPSRGILFSGAKNGSLAEVSIEGKEPMPSVLCLAPSKPDGEPDIVRAVMAYNEVCTIILMSSGKLYYFHRDDPRSLKTLHKCKDMEGKVSFGMTNGHHYIFIGYNHTLLVLKLAPAIEGPVVRSIPYLEVMEECYNFTFEHPETNEWKRLSKSDVVLGLFKLEGNRILVNLANSLHTVDIGFTLHGYETGIRTEKLGSKDKGILKIPLVTAAAECVGVEGFIIIGDDKGSINGYSWLKKNHLFSLPSSGSPITYLETNFVEGGRDLDIMASGFHAGYLTNFRMNDTLTGCFEMKRIRIPYDSVESAHEFGIFGKILVGFESTQAVFYSMKTQSIIFRINCGGVHRSWDFILEKKCGLGSFVFVKDKVVYGCRVNVTEALPKIRDGTHLATINCGVDITVSRSGSNIATAGEDNTIHLYSLSQQENLSYELKLDHELVFHKSSVRALAYQPLNDNLGYLVSGGGRSELSVCRLVRSAYSRRICSVDVMNPNRDVNDLNFDITTDVRLMDISTCLRPFRETERTRSRKLENPFLVFVACSNGTIRVFETTENNQGIVKLCAILETKTHLCDDSWAVTRVKVVSTGNHEYRVFGVTSNGAFSVWFVTISDTVLAGSLAGGDVVPRLSPTYMKECLLECSITALEVVELEKDKFAVIIGGDDGTVKYYIIWIYSNIYIQLKWSKSKFHRSTIMCIRKSSGTEFFVSSVDQVLSKWDVEGTLLFETLMGVTDCQAVIVSEDKVFCLGNGLSVLDVPETCASPEFSDTSDSD